MKNRKNIYKIVGVVILIDQIIKVIIQTNLNLYEQIRIIPNFFSICYERNTGAAFSILENSTLFLIILSVIFLLGIDKYIRKEEMSLNKLSIISFGLIIGGIYGNLIDRVLYHSVTDFLSFTFFNYHFPIFNIADMGITIGAFLLILDIWKSKEKNTK